MNDQNKLQKTLDALWGSGAGVRGQSQFAREVDCDGRKVRHWIAGTIKVPDFVWATLQKLVKKKIEKLREIEKILSETD